MDSRAPVSSERCAAGFSLGGRAGRAVLVVLVSGVLLGGPSLLAQYQYERPVDVAPSEEDIGGDYRLPEVQVYPPRAQWREAVDVLVLAAALGAGAWIVLGQRRRNWLVVLTIGCLLYFGLYREGCICPIGAIQNVTVALTDGEYAISYFVIAFFFIPLILAVLFGRVFCGGVCPLGAIQELVLLRPVRVPRRLDKALGSLKWIYLALAIWFAAQPALERDFIICRFDPFVGFFRFTGPDYMLWIGGGLLIVGLFVGRPYCRYLCPYGVLLSLLSRVSWRGVTITPDKELDCGLCAEACPYGAIERRQAAGAETGRYVAVRSACLFCARCFKYCPRQRVLERSEPAEQTTEPTAT